MDVIQPLDQHALFMLLLQVGLLLLTARALGELAVRFRLPSVLGELLAGILLGPSILGTVAPGLAAVVIPQDAAQFHLLEVVAYLGVLMLLVVTGLEIDLGLLVQKGRMAIAISWSGILVTFSSGFVLGNLLPERFVVDPTQRLVFALFIGVAMSISAIPVIAKVLIEMGVVRRDIGQITLAAGMSDDTVGWILLSIIAGLARSGAVDVPAAVQAVLSVLVVVGLAFTAGRRLVAALFRAVDVRIGGDVAKITLLMILAFLFGAVTQFLGIEAVLGAFLVGILTGRVKRFPQRARHSFEAVTLGVFAPIFFATSGLRVDLAALADPTVAMVGLLVLATAVAGKFAGVLLGARLAGLGRWEALSLGAGMNARGAIEIIIATVGLSLGVLTQEMYTIILMIAIVTSLMAPPLLRWTLQRVPITDVERHRLEADERRRTSFLGNVHRVLLPTRGGLNSQIAARLVRLIIGDDDVEVTTMSVVDEPQPAVVGARPGSAVAQSAVVDAEETLDRVDRQLTDLPSRNRRRVVQPPTGDGDVVGAILTQARRGYDLLALGATESGERNSDDPLFGTTIDRLIQDTPCPVLVVSHRNGVPIEVEQLPIRRILLPTTGTEAGRRAAEVAFALARDRDAIVEVLHVVERGPHVDPLHGTVDLGSALEIGRELVNREAELARDLGAAVHTRIEVSDRPEQGIIETIDELGIDLVVLSSNLRPVSQRAFFGHRVDHVLRSTTCPVVIVT